MLSEKSIVTSLTSSRFSSGIMESILVTSATVVPLTAATSVPPLPWPSLLERNVNRSLCSIVSSMLSLSPMFPSRSIHSPACAFWLQLPKSLRCSL